MRLDDVDGRGLSRPSTWFGLRGPNARSTTSQQHSEVRRGWTTWMPEQDSMGPAAGFDIQRLQTSWNGAIR